jgi:ADP-heptose:LPS heptosyltransferase
LPYQILSRLFGLKTPVEERLYVPWQIEDDPALMNFIPQEWPHVVICRNSDSPRKQAGIAKWEDLVRQLRDAGVFVIQAGKHSDAYIKGSYNLLGLTTIRQLVSLLSRVDAVITSDNFVMHAAHLRNVPAVALWGPTRHTVYGYEDQVHFQAEPSCASQGCIGVSKGHLYGTRCPEPMHCMDRINMEDVCRAALSILAGERPTVADFKVKNISSPLRGGSRWGRF